VRDCERHGPQQARRLPLIPENVAPDLRLRGALGGTRTPNLLIRRSGQAVQDRPLRSVRWADIPQLSVRDRCCPAAWLQSWLQSPRNGADPRPSAFRPDISPVAADRAGVMRCRGSGPVAGGRWCCCHRCCQFSPSHSVTSRPRPQTTPATEDGKRRGSMSYCSVSASTASMRA
jgi:hypothetical protein